MRENDLASIVPPSSPELQQQLRELFPEGLLPFHPHAAYDAELDALTVLAESGTLAPHSIANGAIELLFDRTRSRIVGVKINGFSRLATRSHSFSAPEHNSVE